MARSIDQPFTYYGGKQNIAHEIVKLIPPNIQCYCEPYCGGSSVFFLLKKLRGDKIIYVLNDLDKRIVTLFRVLQDKDKTKDLLRKIKYTPYAKDEYCKSKEIGENLGEYSDIDIAWACFVELNMGFASKFNAGWGFAIKNNNSQCSKFQIKKKRLKKVIDALHSVYIDYDDAFKIIKKYDGVNSFFYIDPPYINTNQGNYSKKMSIDQYKELLNILNNIKGSFVLSGYQNEYIPKEWEFKTIDALNYSAKIKRSPRVEYLWFKYNSLHFKSFDLKLF